MKKKIDTEKKIRLRFPPSPTGPLHIGNARTLLFNYLFAKKYGGEIVLRIEDTDTQRSELKWVQEIIDELTWMGITWDEGPDVGGEYGPYKQSQRLDIYKEYLEKLLKEPFDSAQGKKAYYCFCTSEDLEAKRQDQQSRGLAPKYDGTCRNLPEEKVNHNLAQEKKSVIRFHVESKKIKFQDLIRGEVEFDTGLFGDLVIAKNVMEPLYNFAVVVDDFLMQISHVIRGEDHISNTPKQILLQEALGFDGLTYAHLPLMLNPDKSKMSKRAGDVAVSDYHRNGYLPEALINFMVLLGWNPGTPSTHRSGQAEKDIFTLDQLVKEFSIEKVQKSGAVFNLQKLDYLNGYYIREKAIGKLTKLCMPYLADFDTAQYSEKTLEKIVEAYQARLKKLSDIKEFTDFFFVENIWNDPSTHSINSEQAGSGQAKKILAWKEMGDREVVDSLQYSATIIEATKDLDKKSLEDLLSKSAEKFNIEKSYPEKNKGYLLWPLRVALSGKEASASPFEIIEILGKEKTLRRIQDAINTLK